MERVEDGLGVGVVDIEWRVFGRVIACCDIRRKEKLRRFVECRRCRMGIGIEAAVQEGPLSVGCSFRLVSAERSGLEGGTSIVRWPWLPCWKKSHLVYGDSLSLL